MKLRVLLPISFLAAAFAYTAVATGSDTTSTIATSGAANTVRFGQALRLTTASDGNEARYRVREQLARIDFPSDAVGRTSAVTGTIVIEPNGSVVSDQSKFTIDLTTLESDSDRRDGYISRRTLQTAEYPSAVFVPTSFRNLPSPLPASGQLTFQLTGDLTVHGVTKPVTWAVTAQAANGSYDGSATTWFRFNDFGMEIPRVASVLSVKDSIVLEYDFRLVPATRP